MIPYGKQTIEEDDIQAVIEVLRSDWLTTGPKVKEFEDAFAEYVGTRYAVSFTSGTAALHGAVSYVDYLEIASRHEIITTPMTFAATANSILYSEFTPVFADIEEDTLLINPESVRDAVTSETVAILAVDYAGKPCDYDALREIADKHDLFLIADACHSLGATDKGRKVGTLADMTVFSFHPVKLITTGEGGMVTTDDKDAVKFLREFRNHGRRDGVMEFLGFNYRLTDIQSALGLSQLRRIDSFIEARQNVACFYDVYFSDNYYNKYYSHANRVTPLNIREDKEHAYHLYVVKLENREEMIKILNDAEIATVIHYPPVYTHSIYPPDNKCPIADKVSKQILSLPIYPTLTPENQMKVVNTLMEVS